MIPAERSLLEATGGSIVTGGGLAFHPGLSESGQACPVNGQPSSEASIRKSILVADGQGLPPQTKMSLAKAVRTMMAPSMSIMSMVVASPFL
jgi:hypothetical protein